MTLSLLWPAFLSEAVLYSPILREAGYRELFVAIVKRSKSLFERQYGGKFYVVYWDLGDWDDQVLMEALRREYIQVFPVSEILPDYRKNRERYHLPDDGHSTEAANQIIAQYLLRMNL